MEEDRVRVLDESAPEPPPRSRLAPLLGVLGVVAVIGAVVFGLTSVESLQPEETLPTLAPVVTASTAVTSPVSVPAIPDLRGLALRDAAFELNATGPPPKIELRWRAANGMPESRVLAQEPAPGDTWADTVVLTLSAGGPAINATEMPDHILEWALQHPEFSLLEPILVTQTEFGAVYKTDDLLFGECVAVNSALGRYPDEQFHTACTEPVDRTEVDGVLPNGIAYRVSGLPTGEHAVVGISGVVMIEQGDSARALGTINWHQGDVAEPFVEWIGDQLRVGAGTTWFSIDVYRDVPLSDDQRVAIATDTTPFVSDGDLVVTWPDFVRFQEPWELPDRLGVIYDLFSVVDGCTIDPAADEVCVDGQIAVVALSPVIAPGTLTIEQTGFVSYETRTVELEQVGLSVSYPDQWTRAEEPLTSASDFATELFTAGTGLVQPSGGSCQQVPEYALRVLGPSDVLVALSLIDVVGAGVPWPDTFDDSTFPNVGTIYASRCAQRPDLDIRHRFLDHGELTVFALVAFGEEASPELRDQVWGVLNSIEKPGP